MNAFRHLAAIAMASFYVTASGQPVDENTAPGGPARAQSCDLMTLSAQTRQLSLREGVVAALQDSAECLARNDAQCANQLLSQVDVTSLSTDEKALLIGAQADVAGVQSDRETAARLFREALSQPGLSSEARTVIAEKYAAAALVQSDFATALRVLNTAFDCDSWTAQALAIRAAAYQRIFANQPAMESIEGAIRLYEAAGRAIPAGVTSIRHQLVESQPRDTRARAADPNGGSDIAAGTTVAPDYPPRALSNGIVGCVRLEFSITDNGNVENARVVKSSRELFEQEALETIAKWRYAPPLQDGLPTRRDGVQTTIRWALSNARGDTQGGDCDS